MNFLEMINSAKNAQNTANNELALELAQSALSIFAEKVGFILPILQTPKFLILLRTEDSIKKNEFWDFLKDPFFINLNKQNLEINYFYALIFTLNLLKNMKKFESALKMSNEIICAFPDAQDAYYEKILLLFQIDKISALKEINSLETTILNSIKNTESNTQNKTDSIPQVNKLYLFLIQKLLPLNAKIFYELGMLENALLCYQKCDQLAKEQNIEQNAEFFLEYGNTFSAYGDFNSSLMLLQIAQNLEPKNQKISLELAHLLLRGNHFSTALNYYEARFAFSNKKEPDMIDLYAKSANAFLQNKDFLCGKKVLLYRQQGIGDDLMFARFIPDLLKKISQEPKALTIIVHNEILSFFKLLLSPFTKQITIINSDDTKESEKIDFDFALPLCSLPYFAGFTEIPKPLYLDSIPTTIESENTKKQKKTKPKIALFWKTTTYTSGASRSMPLSDLLIAIKPYFNEFEFISIQKDLLSHEKELLEKNAIANLGENLSDFLDTYELLKTCFGIFCVDTAVAHLAQCMRMPCVIALHKYFEWRWGFLENSLSLTNSDSLIKPIESSSIDQTKSLPFLTNRTKSPWYPNAIALVQENLGQWQSVIENAMKYFLYLKNK